MVNGSKQRRLPNYTCKVKTAKQWIYHDDDDPPEFHLLLLLLVTRYLRAIVDMSFINFVASVRVRGLMRIYSWGTKGLNKTRF